MKKREIYWSTVSGIPWNSYLEIVFCFSGMDFIWSASTSLQSFLLSSDGLQYDFSELSDLQKNKQTKNN